MDIAGSATYFEDLGEGLHDPRFFVAEDLYRVNEHDFSLWPIAEWFENWGVFLLVRIHVNVTSGEGKISHAP